MARALAAFACVVAAAAASAPGPTAVSITLDGSTTSFPYEGHGALSAGASSRLLWDYAEPQRSQVLDYLFKPQFGAGLHTLKVEIGGDAQSTDGTEPSHEHTRDDLSCSRGYELWLIQQAKLRQPSIQVYGLSWGVPLWVGNGTYYSADNVAYQTEWVKCIEQEAGAKVDFLGLWNERPQPDADYVLALRASLDAAGYTSTKIIVMDGGLDTDEVDFAQTNASYAAAVYGAGLHYPCNRPAPQVRDLGWTFWASEDYSRDPAWSNGGTYWGKALSQNFVLMNMTATIAWSLIWSTYTSFVCNGAGLMRAHQPWTGNYEASAPIWMSAHWTQFVSPGWRFLSVPGGGSGFLHPAGSTTSISGTYVTLVPPTDLSGLTIIVETLQNNDCIDRNYSNFDLTFKLTNGLVGPGTVLHVWATTSTSYFQPLPDVTVAADGTVSVLVDADAIITLSTTAGATHGTFPDSPIPAAAPWPLPYSDTFDESAYPYDSMAHFLADQGGSFAVRNGSLVQLAPADPGPNGWAGNPNPFTILGDETWSDYAISVVAVFNNSAPPAPPQQRGGSSGARGGSGTGSGSGSRGARDVVSRNRVRQWRMGMGMEEEEVEEVDAAAESSSALGNEPTLMAPCDAADAAQTWAFGNPAPEYLSNTVGFNQQCLNVNGCQPSSIIYYQCVDDPSGSSCGAPAGQYPNLMWSINASGALVSPMDGWALTLNATDKQTLYLSPFVGTNPLQVWSYDAATGLLSVPAAGLCLSTPPRKVYAQVCGRITSYDGFSATTATAGYCMRVEASGVWTLTGNGNALATGNMTSGFDSTVPHTLALSMAGPVVEGYIDGTLLAQVVDNGFIVGNAGLGGGWHASSFDNLNITVPYPGTVERAAEVVAAAAQ